MKTKKSFLTKNYIDLDAFNRNKLDQNKISKFKEEFSITENDIVIVLVGRMIWPKGIKEFVDASKITLSSHANIKYWLL